MRSDTTIKHEGFNALKERLGVVDMERFIVLINRELIIQNGEKNCLKI